MGRVMGWASEASEAATGAPWQISCVDLTVLIVDYRDFQVWSSDHKSLSLVQSLLFSPCPACRFGRCDSFVIALIKCCIWHDIHALLPSRLSLLSSKIPSSYKCEINFQDYCLCFKL